MENAIYGYDIRTLICSYCGAAMDVPLAGGNMCCAYCGTTQIIAPRQDLSPRIAAHEEIGESERFALLREQAARPRILPPEISDFLWDDEIPPEKLQEALSRWQGLRQQVQAGAPFPDQDRFFFLTVYIARATEHRVRRALLENALEILADDRHRQVLGCQMAENAVLADDLQAAQEWLRPCNPRPKDLQMDTAFRLATAFLATAQGRYQEVLTLLGAQSEDVPLANDLATNRAGLLRANAAEHLQGPSAAHSQLEELIVRDPRRVHTFAHLVRELSPLDLCVASLPGATASAWTRIDRKLRPPPSRGLLIVLKTSLALTFGFWITALLLVFGVFGQYKAVNIHALTLFMLGVPSGLALFLARGRYRYVKRLRTHGQRAYARVVACEKHPRYSDPKQQITVEVTLDGGAITSKQTVDGALPVPPGTYPCLVDPQYPQRVFEIQVAEIPIG